MLSMEQSPFMERDPCPDRIIDDAGGGFGMGAVGGSAYHFAKGFRNSPNGARIVGGMQAVRMNVPRIAGGFGVWCTLFSTCDCAMAFARKKEDPYNSILAGAATGGILAARQGLCAAVSASLQGGVFLALIGGVGIMLSNRPTGPVPVDDPFVPHVENSHVGGLFGGLFRRRAEGGATNSSNKTEIVETLDMPSIPTPSFEYK